MALSDADVQKQVIIQIKFEYRNFANSTNFSLSTCLSKSLTFELLSLQNTIDLSYPTIKYH